MNIFELNKTEAKRHVLCCGNKEIELHRLCDASTWAYWEAAYVRSVCEHGVKVCLWTAKSCVVPTKVNAVPRLELMLLSKLVVLLELACWENVGGYKSCLLFSFPNCVVVVKVDSEGLEVVG